MGKEYEQENYGFKKKWAKCSNSLVKKIYD